MLHVRRDACGLRHSRLRKTLARSSKSISTGDLAANFPAPRTLAANIAEATWRSQAHGSTRAFRPTRQPERLDRKQASREQRRRILSKARWEPAETAETSYATAAASQRPQTVAQSTRNQGPTTHATRSAVHFSYKVFGLFFSCFLLFSRCHHFMNRDSRFAVAVKRLLISAPILNVQAAV